MMANIIQQQWNIIAKSEIPTKYNQSYVVGKRCYKKNT